MKAPRPRVGAEAPSIARSGKGSAAVLVRHPAWRRFRWPAVTVGAIAAALLLAYFVTRPIRSTLIVVTPVSTEDLLPLSTELTDHTQIDT